MNHHPPNTHDANKIGATSSPSTAPRTVDSHELLGAQGVLYIRHQNEVYRLQTTRFGKLILTK